MSTLLIILLAVIVIAIALRLFIGARDTVSGSRLNFNAREHRRRLLEQNKRLRRH
jgi:hypothetical protein